MKKPLTFVKIIATPTLSSWSQAYSAGNVAAVVSLTKIPVAVKNEDVGTEEAVSLPSLGKELLNTLEAEYFTLETKNLSSIKKAVEVTCEKVPSGIKLSFATAVIIENVLYLYVCGSGKILMKRHEKLGVLLEQNGDKHQTNISVASGFIQNGDIILLQTEQFSELVSLEKVSSCLMPEKLSQFSDNISPIIHDEQNGGASAIAFLYQESEAVKEKDVSEIKTEKVDVSLEEPFIAIEKKQKRKISLSFSHSRRIFLTIAIIIIIVFAGSIFFAVKKRQMITRQKIFQSKILPAQKKVDEGEGLLDLNKSAAKDDFQSAKTLVQEAQNQFPSTSPEGQQLITLMKRIDIDLTKALDANTIDAKSIDLSSSNALQALSNHTDSQYVSEDDKNIYIANNTGIISINKKDQKEKTLIKNTTDWKDVGGFGVYLGNFYVLDKKDGIIKYISSGSSFSKSAYFSTAPPDLSKTVDIAIDGSIWILNSDGGIAKFTHGKADDFSVKGIDKPFSHPLRIATDVDTTNIYILDTGNKRIVVLGKNGTYLAQYQSSVLIDTTAFQVIESQKKIYILAKNKLYEIDMK